VIYILLMLTITNTLKSQDTIISNCDFKFHLSINTGDSIKLYNDENELITYWTVTDSSTNFEPFILVDKYRNGMVRVSKIDAVVINKHINNYYETIDTYEDNKIDSLNNLCNLLWIEIKNLNTDFDEWVFMEREIDYGGINQLYIYSNPTLESDKKILNSLKWVEFSNNQYKIDYKFDILECKGQWIKIKLMTKDEVLIGWMPYYSFCYNTLTNCHNLPEDGVENAE